MLFNQRNQNICSSVSAQARKIFVEVTFPLPAQRDTLPLTRCECHLLI